MSLRITKLHLIVFFLITAAGVYGFYFTSVKNKERQEKLKAVIIRQKQIEEEARKNASTQPPAPAPAGETAQAETPVQEKTQAAEQNTEGTKHENISYVVKKGDTLWKIAKMDDHFGLGHRWYDIWKANESVIEDFDNIEEGQVLTIPLEKPEDYQWEKTPEEKKQKIIRESKRKFRTATN